MQSCITASLELCARDYGLEYISKDAIFSSAKCPASTRSVPNPLAIPAAGVAIKPPSFLTTYSDSTKLATAIGFSPQRIGSRLRLRA